MYVCGGEGRCDLMDFVIVKSTFCGTMPCLGSGERRREWSLEITGVVLMCHEVPRPGANLVKEYVHRAKRVVCMIPRSDSKEYVLYQ